jgi:disulfide bond formation protein DsbB
LKSHRIMEQAFFASWVVSLIATGGSLFFSEVLKYIPCELCWYQRIFMYPLVILLGVASAKKDYAMSRYAFILSVIGGSISLYHYLIQKVPALHDLGNACGIIPCNTDYINWLGFITIPFLALVAFILVAGLQVFIWQKEKECKTA